MTEKRTKIVTPEMLHEGYYEAGSDDPRMPPIVYNREFHVVAKLPDGNWLVVDPNQEAE